MTKQRAGCGRAEARPLQNGGADFQTTVNRVFWEPVKPRPDSERTKLRFVSGHRFSDGINGCLLTAAVFISTANQQVLWLRLRRRWRRLVLNLLSALFGFVSSFVSTLLRRVLDFVPRFLGCLLGGMTGVLDVLACPLVGLREPDCQRHSKQEHGKNHFVCHHAHCSSP